MKQLPKALDLVARVAARRISSVISHENGARVMYAIVDLGRELTSAIAGELAKRSHDGAKIEVAVHPQLAADWLDAELRKNDLATRFRNRKEEGVVATVFSVPARQIEGVLQSLGTVERVNDPWLCDCAKANLWATETLPSYDEVMIQKPFEKILCGLMDSGILVSAHMLANFCAEVHRNMDGQKALALGEAINEAFPELRLPRKCAPELKASSLATNSAVQFRRWRDEYQPHFYLEAKDGQMRPRQASIARIDELEESGDLEDDAALALRGLVNDLSLTAGIWCESQRRVADLPWAKVQPFFRERIRQQSEPLGECTINYLDDEFPGALSERDKGVLDEVRRETDDATPEREEVFLRHRERLSSNGRLYKRWERLVFKKPVESDDLLTGLIRLAERACQRADDVEDPILFVRLRNAEKMSYWTTDKNTDLCAYLRDRYRGLDKVLSGHTRLDFGRCWKTDWEARVEERNEKGSASAEFEFEAFVVSKAELSTVESKAGPWRHGNKAQLTWKPGNLTFAAALAGDLKRVLPSDQERANLLRSKIRPARRASGGASERATVERVTSITDSLGESRGSLANPIEQSGIAWNRIDAWCLSKIQEHGRSELGDDETKMLTQAFDTFHLQYSEAISEITSGDGQGLASDAMVNQAESYGALLEQLRRTARADILVRDVWEPLLQIGTSTVAGDTNAMIVTPWHPLRLAELAVKASQAAQVIEYILRGPSKKAREVEHYAADRSQALHRSYYANVGVVRTDSELRLLFEAESRAGYSLLEPPYWEDDRTLADEPVHHAVEKFGEIADQYLKLRPHEKANFSSVLLDVEVEDLPHLVAKALARKIEDEAEFRCDLVVTHENQQKLRQIYEKQNRLIGQEFESSLASEAGHNFLSRLRVGITPPELLINSNGTKQNDIVMLHDVIARRAEVTWHETPPPRKENELRFHIPTQVSRRKTQLSGGLSTSVYLTSPSQVSCSQAYLDVMHDVVEGRAFDENVHFLPAQKVELGSKLVADKFREAHKMANWVITYDRLADRRLIAGSDSKPKILRYFSSPRSSHNVIVSTELSRDQLRGRLQKDLENILPAEDDDTLERLVGTIQDRATGLSGNIAMRGAHWDNYSQELLGLIVAQREIELLLSKGGESRTAMFFLDEFRSWLDLSGEIADILAVDLCGSQDTGPQVRLVIVEAKCIGEGGTAASAKRSWSQLEGTYAAMTNRFMLEGSTTGQEIWWHRLADMLVEHMDPWGERDKIAGCTFEDWLDSIRRGRIPFKVSGHSILSVRSEEASTSGDLKPRTDEPTSLGHTYRKLAQWKLGADEIVRTIRGIAHNQSHYHLYEPKEWVQAEATPSRRPDDPEVRQHTLAIETKYSSWASKYRRGEQNLGDEEANFGSEGRNVAANSAIATERSRPQVPPQNLTRDVGEPVFARDVPKDPVDLSNGTVDNEEQTSSIKEGHMSEPPKGWRSVIHDSVASMRRPNEQRAGDEWLKEIVNAFKQALQAEEMSAPVEKAVLTPNSALLHVAGRKLTVKWLETKQTDLMTRYGVEIIRITPMAGRIAVALKRPDRGVLHLSDVWARRKFEPSAPTKNMALLVGEQEDDGELFYVSLEGDFAGREQAAPHTLISGTTGSGKGMLVSNLILDVCAFNDPRSVEIYLIDPKRGADYLWARELPHLRDGIVDERDAAIALLGRLVAEMEQRYRQITQAGCANILQYNRGRDAAAKLPRVIIFFDEVANWMQDDDFKKEVEGVINEIATKSRAAGLHLFMIYQRADNQVMSMQLRTNLGNKLILRLGDEGSSRIALGEKGAERLQGKGHIIAKLGTNESIFGQVPFIEQDEAHSLANAIAAAWARKTR